MKNNNDRSDAVVVGFFEGCRVVRWDARSAFPLRALAKAPYADGVVPTFFLCPRSCEHGAGCGDPVGRVPQGTRSPYGHEHNDMLEKEG